ncbi:hypothetical protein DFH09DRAFT_1472839 [Mycena vulgaris]|nr:hypothetical protein DFH09DRAFT_1472839 [Mycena vulgaris]
MLAVHNHFAQKFGEHREGGGVHPEQWMLNVLSQVIYYPNISDAIDDDGSGYISVHEVNHFFKAGGMVCGAVALVVRPFPIAGESWAAGWKQNALSYKTRCKALFSDLEASARTVLPPNRRCVKSYIKTSGLSELWLVVNSLTADGPHRAVHQAPEMEPLNELREEIMRKETEHIQARLHRIQYQLDSPETVLAVLGTHRLEGLIFCFLELVLERHRKIIEAANTLVLSERELETMTFSLKNLVAASSTRYHTLIQSWKQQRLDTGFLVQCFAGGIFSDWHDVFQDHPAAHNEVETPTTLAWHAREGRRRDRSPARPEEILVFPLPPQPSPTGTSSDDSGRSSPPRRLAPLPLPQGPRRNAHQRTSNYFYHFDFERRPSEKPAPSGDPASISEVYRKTKKPKLEDRITSLETELSDIKGMLNQLILLSTPRRGDV